jgi:aromatic ring-cleaving dioxygenase
MQKNPADVHFYFTLETKDSALKVREELKNKFSFLLFHEPHFKNIGPHLQPMWEADFTNSTNFYEDFGKVTIWLMLNRNGHSVLIHPHTGDSFMDHTTHAIWLGDKLPLDFNKL